MKKKIMISSMYSPLRVKCKSTKKIEVTLHTGHSNKETIMLSILYHLKDTRIMAELFVKCFEFPFPKL